MGNQEKDSDGTDRGEIQALMCNEVLQDWLRHLEAQAGRGSELPCEAENAHRPDPMR